MGRPLIATDVPGCREVIENASNGFLCEVRNPASLAAAMSNFLALSPGDRSKMGAASRKMVESRFSENVVIQAYLDALGYVAAKRS